MNLLLVIPYCLELGIALAVALCGGVIACKQVLLLPLSGPSHHLFLVYLTL